MTSRFDPALLPAAPNTLFEEQLWCAGIERIAGIDEVGRGALAGPVGAAVVILPSARDALATLAGMNDSKKHTSEQRTVWSEKIRRVALAYATGFAGAIEIDQIGILPATRLAIQRALDRLSITPDHLLLDCLFLPDSPLPQTSLVKGDERSLSIAAASIIAKTERDKLLIEMDAIFPAYRFAANKGYATKYHRAAIGTAGPSSYHRFSFSPLREKETP